MDRAEAGNTRPLEEIPLRTVAVPVLDDDGSVRLVLTAYGLPPSSTVGELETYRGALRCLAVSLDLP